MAAITENLIFVNISVTAHGTKIILVSIHMFSGYRIGLISYIGLVSICNVCVYVAWLISLIAIIATPISRLAVCVFLC